MEHVPQKLFKATVFSAEMVAEGVKKITFIISEPFSFVAGQYVWIEIPELKVKDPKGNRRAFTICNTPNPENTISVVSRVSDSGYKQTLFALNVDDEVNIHGPFGSAFVLNGKQTKNIIMIAGGVGVAAFWATINTIVDQSLNIKCFLVYLNKKSEATPFLKELEEFKRNDGSFDYDRCNYKISYDFFSWDDVKSAYADLDGHTKWWISGPQAMVDNVYDVLKKNGVSEVDMVFENYYPTQARSLTFEKIKEQLKKEDMFTQIIRHSADHTIITDTNGVILFANEAAEETTGYSQEEILGNTPRLWGGMMSPTFYKDFWSKKKTERFFDAEIINRRKDGKIYYVLAYITQIFDDEKKLIGYIGMEKNITGKVEIEERIRLQYELTSQFATGIFGMELLQKVLELIQEGLHWDFGAIWIPSLIGDELRCVYTLSGKPAKYATFEKKTREIVFKNGVGLPGRTYKSHTPEWVLDVVVDTNFPRAQYAKEADLHTGFAFPIYEVYEGERIYAVFEFFSEDLRPLDDYLLKTYYLIGHQIGQYWFKKEQEMQMKSLLERFDLATKSANIGVWELNLEKEELFWDDTMYRLFGVKKPDAGASANITDIVTLRKKAIYPEDFARENQERTKALEGTNPYDTTFRVIWDDGSVHYLRSFGVVEKNQAGAPARMIGVNWDVTKEKEADHIKSEFVSLASHQLRTPLMGIEWTAELFAKKEKLTEKGIKYLNDISFSAKRLSTLVRLLLDVSRIESGNIGVSPESIDLVLFMKEHLENMRMLYEKKGLSCFFTKENPRECIITTDKNLLGYIMQNVISNAIEYTNAGGNVSITLEKNHGTALVKVEDTGIGIPKKELGRIFGKFFRASNATAIKPDGTGLGLYIVSEAVKLLGGNIRVESEEGKGSTFFIELPLMARPHAGEKTLVQTVVNSEV